MLTITAYTVKQLLHLIDPAILCLADNAVQPLIVSLPPLHYNAAQKPLM